MATAAPPRHLQKAIKFFFFFFFGLAKLAQWHINFNKLAQLAPEIGQVQSEATIRVHLNAKGEKEEKAKEK